MNFFDMRILNLMLLSFIFLMLLLFLNACSAKKEVLTQSKIIKQEIPQSLLELKPLQKPVVKTELDILKAYSNLFKAYKECELNINKIKDLQKDSK